MVKIWRPGLESKQKKTNVGRIGRLILLGLFCFIMVFYYDYGYRAIYQFYNENFDFPTKARDLKGKVDQSIVLDSWISFYYPDKIALKHPENFRVVPCDIDEIHFFDISEAASIPESTV